MGKDYTVEPDQFYNAIDSILREVEHNVDMTCKKGVRRALSKAKKVAKAGAPVGRGSKKGHYKDGFTSKTKGTGYGIVGEVGNKLKPGLVHLLEHGHETIGGGRAPAHPHMRQASDAGSAELVRTVREMQL